MKKAFAVLIVAVGMTFCTAGVAAADPVQPGCVYSGGGWLCGGVLPPDVTPEPEPPAEPVVEAPAEPVEEVPAPVEEVVEPVVEAPAEPVVDAPTAPVVETPEVVTPEPTEPVIEEPAEPVAPTIITVWPDAPTFIDECGEANDRVVIPANTEQYTYESIEVSAGTQELIDASVWVIPNTGYQFVADDLGGAVPVETAGPYWDHEFTIEPCPVVVVPEIPAEAISPVAPVADDTPAESAEPTAARLAETGSDGGALFGGLLAGLLLLAAGTGTVFAVRATRRGER